MTGERQNKSQKKGAGGGGKRRGGTNGEKKGEDNEEGERSEGRRRKGITTCNRASNHMILCLWPHDSHVMVPMGSSSDENTVSTSLPWLDSSC